QFLATKNRTYVFSALSSTLVNPDLNLQKFFESISFGSPTEGNVIHEGPSEVQLLYSLSITKEGDPPPFVGREVTQKARVLSKPEPTYTEEGRQTQTTGTVVLRAVFSETGEVIKIRALSGLPHGLTQKAIDAARQIKFIPAIKDGRFVSTHIQLEYNFNLY
ncbi:MAG TPA: energy transducer TonB, partial [Pyrinomonadaceae bacterium]|nr:energy transducer TonB [Pyrinomonadaceae bacterium]